MPSRPVLYGAAYSVYVQAARLTLQEKAVGYDLVEVDVFAPSGPPPEHLARHPFGKIPAFEHDGFRLYETGPICRYIDEAFPGAALQPADPKARARMGQAIAVLDNYVYTSMVWGLYSEQVGKPARGMTPDLKRIEAARKTAARCLSALEAIAPDAEWLAGDALTLADLHGAPMFSLFMQAPDAAELLDPGSRIASWWARVSKHPGVAKIVGLDPGVA